MADTPTREFGRRRPAPVQPIQHTAPGKRSSQVALLLMGTLAVGGGAAAFLPRSNCQPNQPGLATPSGEPTGADCQSRGTSYGGGHGGSSAGAWSRSSFFSSDSGSNHASSGTSDSGSGGVSRGGFGSFARAMSVHFSGGG
jgi:hypothetical protein